MSIAADTEPTLNGLAGMVEAMRFASHGDPHQIISAPKMGATQALSRGQAAAVLLEADDRLAMSALRVLLTDGGRVSAGLDRAADAIRGRHTIADQREAQAAQARMSARVLGALAPGFALWTVSTDSRVCSFLLGSIPGLVCVAVGLGLSATGYWWMRRIVQMIQCPEHLWNQWLNVFHAIAVCYDYKDSNWQRGEILLKLDVLIGC